MGYSKEELSKKLKDISWN